MVYSFGIHKKMEGLICFHVDDLLFTGSWQFHNIVINHLQTQFQLSNDSLNEMFIHRH